MSSVTSWPSAQKSDDATPDRRGERRGWSDEETSSRSACLLSSVPSASCKGAGGGIVGVKVGGLKVSGVTVGGVKVGGVERSAQVVGNEVGSAAGIGGVVVSSNSGNTLKSFGSMGMSV